MNVIQNEACRAIVDVFETGRVRGEDSGAVGVCRATRDTSPIVGTPGLPGRRQPVQTPGLYCCRKPGARYAKDIEPLLPRFQAIDLTLNTDQDVKALLRRASQEDPVMRGAQDLFFNQHFSRRPATTPRRSD